MGEVDAKCPRCGGNSFILYERMETANVFEVENGKAHPLFRSEELPHRLGFSALCACGHRWTPRYATATRVMDAEEEAREASR